jgi:predicted esterase
VKQTIVGRYLRLLGEAGGVAERLGLSETQRLAELFRCAGADVTIRFANVTHDLTDADVKTARHWLEGPEP